MNIYELLITKKLLGTRHNLKKLAFRSIQERRTA